MAKVSKGFSWGPEKKAQLLQEVRAGKDIKDAANLIGIPPNTAGNWAREAGLGRFSIARKTAKKEMQKMLESGGNESSDGNQALAGVGRGRRYDKALKKSVVAALRAGMSVRDASEKFAINQKAVEQWAWLYRPRKTAKNNAARRQRAKPIKTAPASVLPEKAPAASPKTVSHHSADRTLVAGFLVSSHKSPGGLLDEAKLLLDRLVKEAGHGTHP